MDESKPTLERIPLAQLLCYEDNPVTHSNTQLEEITRSIKTFGFVAPIIVDDSHHILAGHARYLAAKELQMETAPCVVIKNLTDSQKRLYRIADNRISEKREWNYALLQKELQTLATELELDALTVTGFGENQLEKMLENAEADVDALTKTDENAFSLDDPTAPASMHTPTITTLTCPNCGHAIER